MLLLLHPSNLPPSPPHTAVVDPFCYRQFPLSHPTIPYTGATLSLSIHDFESHLNTHLSSKPDLEEGYAPFCKHVFIENKVGDGRLTESKLNTVEINEGNERLIKSGYEARNDKELPVLTRWIDREDVNEGDLLVAEYLDVILYSREQIIKENAAMGEGGVDDHKDVPWGL